MDLSAQQEVHLSHYWNVVQKRWKVAISIFTVVMAGTFLASYFSKPLYQSRAQLQIERENPNQITIEDLFGIEPSDQEFQQTQYVLLRSRGLAERVIREHQLLKDPEFYPAGIEGKSEKQIADITAAMVPAITGGLSVDPVKGTSIVQISYISSSPGLARKICQGVGESFMRMKVEQKLTNVQQASDFLSQQILQVKSDLDKARAELQAYSESKNLISVDNNNQDISVQQFGQITTDLVTVQNERIAKAAAYEGVRRASPEATAANDPLVVQLNEEIARQQREYNDRLSTLKAEHPDMQRRREQLDGTRRQRAAAVNAAYNKVLDAARTEMNAAAAREASMRSAVRSQREETLSQKANVARYNDLKTIVDTKLTLLNTLQKQLTETEVAASLRGSKSSNVHWVEQADLPGGRFNETMKRNIQSAMPLGLILGLAAIFFLEYMDRSLKTPEELERFTRFASLGVIPAASSVKGGYGYSYSSPRGTANLRAVEPPADPNQAPQGIDLLPHTDSRSPISEAYRAFRTSLLLASANSPKVIVITSSFAREGKTTTSVNLATVLAQMGKPVLLVDADLRRPRLQKIFRGKMNLGLVNYLAANIPIEDVVQETSVPNLSVILSGPTPPNPSELLASDRMKHLIHEVRSKFAYVIFDSPPVLAVTDAIVLAANADGVVLTVHGGQTPRELVQRSAERLRQSNIPVLGALLNNLDLSQYGYTYKKSYYDYYDSEQPPQEPKVSSRA